MMKRGKDDEKFMGPMFPRLHVNDTEKGGPRAPPRNKMALYEQLSIPSQRFSPGRLPPNHTNTSNSIPPASSSQGSGHERSAFFPLHLPSSIPASQAEKRRSHQFDAINLEIPLAQLEQRKKVADEEDFSVPIFVQLEVGQCHSKIQNNIDREKINPSIPSYSGRSVKIPSTSDKGLKRTISSSFNTGQEARSQSKGNPREWISSRDDSVKSSNLLAGEKIDGPVKQANASSNQEYGDHEAPNFDKLHGDACLQVYRAWSQPELPGHGDGILDEPMRDTEKDGACQQRSGSLLGERHGSPRDPDIDNEYSADRTRGPLQRGNSDDVSETSMVDSISDLDISPDDVVGIIGQKHFWKARRAIVDQQRVFSVQVFELHRLMKVQKLIAGSPHLLIEDGAYLGKPSLKGSPAKKLPLDYIVKQPPNIVKHKDDSEKSNHKMECSAENAVVKTSISSIKNGSQPLNYGPYLPLPTDTKISPWSFPQPSGHQWLVPVMSPSEGLIYKPYPAPGFMGGGSTPLIGSFMSPSYGSHPHHQGIGVLPGTSPSSHGYFPPYSMPVMNPAVSSSPVERMNRRTGSGSQGANFNVQHQSSSQKSGSISQIMRFPASKESELQGSTANSFNESVQARDAALPLFPTTPVNPEGSSPPQDGEQPIRVIKVVPHNPRSATESAARIFQSIQEERKQHELI